jgi:hypothetical protein
MSITLQFVTVLFGIIDRSSATTGLLLVNAYWVARYGECLDACERLLRDGKMPEQMRERVEMNARFARARLAEQRAAVAPKARAFNICLVTFNEHRVFDNTIRVLHDSLLDLGHACSVKEDELGPGAINIVIGAVVWRARHGSLEFLKSAPYVLYQFEQLFEDRGVMVEVPEYAATIKSATQIFEYSPSNMALLKQLGLKDKTIYLPPSFHRSLEMFYPSLSPMIDVLMVGSYSDRPNRVIEQFRQEGLSVVHALNVYGEELVDYMRKTRIILNIHGPTALPR